MPYSEDQPHRPSGTAFLVAVALVIGFAIVYIIGLRGFQEDSVHRESIYNPDRAVPEAYLQINASVLRVDPLQNSLALRLVFTPKGGLAAEDGRSPRQDVRLSLPAPEGMRELWLRAGQRPQPATLTIGLDGLDSEGDEINQYPLDHYRARLELLVQSGTAPATTPTPAAGSTAAGPAPANPTPASLAAAPRLPAILIFDAAARGMHFESKILPESRSGSIALDLSMRRSRAFIGLVIAIEAVMAILALTAVLVAGAAAMGRRIDFTTIVWVAALLFVFPAMRAAMPGAPPTGGLGDVLVFFWAMLLGGLSMAVLVFLWLRREE